MNEVQVADQLRGSYNEAMLLQINEGGGYVTRDQLEQIAGDPETASVVLVELRLARQESLAADVRLTPFGRRVASLVRESMVSGARRADAVQRAILGWLHDGGVE